MLIDRNMKGKEGTLKGDGGAWKEEEVVLKN